MQRRQKQHRLVVDRPPPAEHRYIRTPVYPSRRRSRIAHGASRKGCDPAHRRARPESATALTRVVWSAPRCEIAKRQQARHPLGPGAAGGSAGAVAAAPDSGRPPSAAGGRLAQRRSGQPARPRKAGAGGGVRRAAAAWLGAFSAARRGWRRWRWRCWWRSATCRPCRAASCGTT